MIRAARLLLLATSAGLALAACVTAYTFARIAFEALTPACQIVALTSSGDIFILGEGDDLNGAAEGQAEAPTGTTEIRLHHCNR